MPSCATTKQLTISNKLKEANKLPFVVINVPLAWTTGEQTRESTSDFVSSFGPTVMQDTTRETRRFKNTLAFPADRMIKGRSHALWLSVAGSCNAQ